jgi:hypothetical protein
VQAFFAAAGAVDVEVHRTIAEGDLVAVHSHESEDVYGCGVPGLVAASVRSSDRYGNATLVRTGAVSIETHDRIR